MKISALAIIAAFTMSITACSESPIDPNKTIEVLNDYSELEAIFDSNPETTWVVNFWATTCPPCLKEMPHFAELDRSTDDDVRVLLVSLDLVEHLESRVYPFVEKHQITPEVQLLGDLNYSAWTDEVDPSWYGALPATMMFKGDEKVFRFGAYESYTELNADLVKVFAD